ncbi:MAG TPA: hypothetical protein VMV09_02630, partial [Candidatus Saccharimonadales bacterium]|nr:hypothetical protein [Candidatus Saccharimonadales bacterium]
MDGVTGTATLDTESTVAEGVAKATAEVKAFGAVNANAHLGVTGISPAVLATLATLKSASSQGDSAASTAALAAAFGLGGGAAGGGGG